MANVYHATLSGDDLHEPKGIESAAAGTVYVADGVGSGTWIVNQQFGAASAGSKTWTLPPGGTTTYTTMNGLTNRFQKGIEVSGATGYYTVVTPGIYLAKANLDGVNWDPADGSVAADVVVNSGVRRAFGLGREIAAPQILEEYLELADGDLVSWRLRKSGSSKPGTWNVTATSVFTSLVFIGAV